MGEAAALPSATKTEHVPHAQQQKRTPCKPPSNKHKPLLNLQKPAREYLDSKSAILATMLPRAGASSHGFVLYQLTAFLTARNRTIGPVKRQIQATVRLPGRGAAHRTAIHAGREIDDIHHALVDWGPAALCLAGLHAASQHVPGRVLECLPTASMLCHLLEVAHTHRMDGG